MTPRQALHKAIVLWRAGRLVDTYTAAILVAAGFNVPALERHYSP